MDTNRIEQVLALQCAALMELKGLSQEERIDVLEGIGDRLIDIGHDLYQYAQLLKEEVDIESAEDDYRKTELLTITN